ncbi:shikimate kinase [Arthrobacter caoxuetaonis]|uniref:Shikimate kinase n=1 Tax=Arthrobacter caoxuetaonis TaxID=2886935 RepID=A0A9X1MER3_9MICC|nr:shikimate kinase [Arthrobacter caoxuetaonis]MCC3282723.1 shikimate kinase [Arthrobacter caoxuetaonis]MCC3297855.1 shikimate kinase [Arthrobacter caoxuetaonis]USQ55956.1 shikimate kinase [Arthrobacter caoxuetaonis]
MPEQQHLVLIGLMAAGKSVVGRQLAARLRLPYVDTDQLVVAEHGPIPEIFARHDESFFRRAEARAVAGALASPVRSVISLGGGAVLDSGTAKLLAQATVVFLDTDLATVLPRISRTAHRPLLAGDPAARWTALAEVRRPIYESLADIVIDSRGLSVAEVVERITAALAEGEH